MSEKKPFSKDNQTKISFLELVELIGATCDYKFCIVDENIDDELMELAAKHGIDLTGYKHVIKTSGVQHSEKRHGSKSNDRTPLTLEDYLLVPYIIKNRDKLSISTSFELGKRVWHSKPYINDHQKTPQNEGLFCYRGGCILSAAPLRLDNHFIFHSVSATN